MLKIEKMDSREKILSTLRKNQPAAALLPDLDIFASSMPDLVEKFSSTLVTIGGAIIQVNNMAQLHEHLSTTFAGKRIVSTIAALTEKIGITDFSQDPHLLENVNVAVLPAQFVVAENGAAWITNEQMGDRALPFITEHLVLVVHKPHILPTLHEAYERIGASAYALGTFIAGPSKTADIEQSLVLGAHGAKSLMVFILP
jgi:L-lactate dehydrogenase complex protein LldG